MTFSKLAFLAIPLALVACAASTAEDLSDEDQEESSEQDLSTTKDVSADFVGVYATPPNKAAGDVTALRLRKDKTFVLVQAGASTKGTFVVRKGAAPEADLRLTLEAGGTRTFKVTLGAEPFRQSLVITRARKTSTLERAPLSCASVNCTAGYGCDVEEKDGVPGPVCNPRTPAWKIALAGYDLWGASVQGVLHGNYGYVGSVGCGISVSGSTITCGTVGWDGYSVGAAIAADGSFVTGTAHGDDNYMAGTVAADGQVTLTAWRKKSCYTVPSGRFCEGKATDASGTAKPYQMCRTKDLVFQSGGWASGYWTDCSKCRPEDDCTRYPAK